MKKLFFMSLLIFLLLGSRLSAGQVNGFIYHRFNEPSLPSTNIQTAVFEQQLNYLKDQQIKVISLPEVVDRLESGRPLPDHAVTLTVDDGYQSFADQAMPLLRRYGYPVALFVNTDAVGQRGYLDWEQLRGLVAEGVTIGNHTASHPYLVDKDAGESDAAWQKRIQRDIEKSQNAFARELGFRPQLFAYPYGEYSDAVIELIRSLGFKAALAQQSGVIHASAQLYNLPRFPMGGPFATLQGFTDKLKMKPLAVAQQIPVDPLVGAQDPPLLTLKLADLAPAAGLINCFVQGGNRCRVQADPARGDGWYQVVADKPLSGRRNKYTLTWQDKGGAWHWFSQPWIHADIREKTTE